jgi:hypothetical protein
VLSSYATATPHVPILKYSGRPVSIGATLFTAVTLHPGVINADIEYTLNPYYLNC